MMVQGKSRLLHERERERERETGSVCVHNQEALEGELQNSASQLGELCEGHRPHK